MQRIMFITFFDPFHVGTRLLSAYMIQFGHEVHFLQFGPIGVPWSKTLLPIIEKRQNDIALKFSLSNSIYHDVTHTEIKLLHQAIGEWHPDILCFSARKQYEPIQDALLPHMRAAAPKALIVGGGFGPTFAPERALRCGADIIVRGEGEGALKEIVEAVDSGQDWKQLKNVCWLENNILTMNPLRPMIEKLDDYPLPLFDATKTSYIDRNEHVQGDMRILRDWPTQWNAYPILASRGCMLHCSYCAAGTLRDFYRDEGFPAPRVRLRSVDSIMQELREAKARGERSVAFLDEYLVRPLPEMFDLFTRYKKEIGLLFTTYIHPAQIVANEKFADLLVEAGLAYMAFGLQTGDEKFALSMYNRRNKNADVITAIKILHDKGLQLEWHYISAGEESAAEDLEKTLDFAAHMPFDPSLVQGVIPKMNRLAVYSGTPLGKKFPNGIKPDPLRERYLTPLFWARQMLDDASFAPLYANEEYQASPKLLQQWVTDETQRRHRAYVEKEAARLAGKKVYFWGHGEVYEKHKHLFKDSEPVCMLHNMGASVPEVDGLKVMHPDDVLKNGESLPIVMFSRGAYIIHRTIMHLYKNHTDKVAVQLQ